MRLAFISNLYPPYVLGGYEILCAQVAQGLARRGHQIEVLAGKPGQGAGDWPPPESSATPQPHYVLPLYAPFDRAAGREPQARWRNSRQAGKIARRLLESIRPDMVMVWSQLRLGPGPARAAQEMKFKVVYTFNDEHPTGFLPLPLTPSPRRLASWLLDRTVFRSATLAGLDLSRTTCISALLKDNLLKAGMKISNSRVIHQGIPISDFPCKEHPGRFGQPAKLLYVGQLHPYKGVHVLVEAVYELATRLGEMAPTLTLAGDGPNEYKDRLTKMIEDKPRQVQLLGRVNRESLSDLYRTHDIFVFPSIWPEPFGLTHLEAMASGLPVVATNNGGQAEMLTDNENSLLIPPDSAPAMVEALTRLLRDQALASRLASAGRKTVEQGYTLERYLDRLEAFLVQCLEQTP